LLSAGFWIEAVAVTDSFEQVEGGIQVLEPDGRYRPVSTPLGFTDFAFRNAVAAFDTAYRMLGRTPTVKEVQKFWPRIPTATYSAHYLTPEFKQALEYRGIEWEPESGLSLEQSMALLKLTDPTDRRTTNVKLKELGIPMARFQAWMKQKLFAESYRARSEDNLKDAIPMALNRLIGNAEAGDQKALEKILEMTGRWNPNERQVEDARTVVLKVIESVIKRVTDPEVRRAILGDVQAEVMSFDILNQRAVEG
jgi:hypothetical protein